jgi:hypothetical protein
MRSFKGASLQYANGYHDGYREALRMWAHWHDGTQLVGSTGTTLKDALDRFEAAFQEQMTVDGFAKPEPKGA